MYTKGEWKAQIGYTDAFVLAVEKKRTTGICLVKAQPNEEAEANANLIAAAPEMYEALEAVYRDVEIQNVEGGSDELNQMVFQALAKAEIK